MYAIIKTGGKQYRVAKDDVIDVELLNVDQGSSIEFSEVLFVNDGNDALIGEPVVAGYIVKGEVVGSAAGPKVVSLKYRPRGHQQKNWGHRQHYTRVKITEIGQENSNKAAPKKAAEKKVEEKPQEDVKSAAQTKATAAPKHQKKKEGE